MASVQYDMLTGTPGRWTQEDLPFASSLAVRGRDEARRREDGTAAGGVLRAAAIALARLAAAHGVGVGVALRRRGRVTLHTVGSGGYARLRNDPSLTQLRAMRSARACR